jgi:Tfp pilus assembly ATPase PilU
MKIQELLERVVKEGASDGFISAQAAPSIKVDGQIYPISEQILSDEEAEALVLSTMREDQTGTPRVQLCPVDGGPRSLPRQRLRTAW